MPCAPPSYATPRNPSLPTDGTAAGVIARYLARGRYGKPDGFYPAQQYVADVAGERLPNGRYRYPVVIFSFPRQSGKTVMARVSQVARAATRPEQVVFYTAQTGLKARARWLDTVKALEADGSPFRRFIRVGRGAGDSHITFPNSSVIRPFPPTANSLHSETPHRVDLDEIWDYTAEQGDALIQAIKPAQLTLRDRQIWMYSAAGDHTSQFMWAWTLIGRAATNNPDSQIAYFEWSAPADADSYDPDVWRAHHPGIGHLIEVEDIADAVSSFPNRVDFDRAYLNRWPAGDEASPINREVWDTRRDDKLGRPDPGEPVITYDVAPGRAEAVILASWTLAGRPVVATLQAGEGAGWLIDAVPEWVELLRPDVVAADSRGEVRAITDRLRRAGLDVHEPKPAEYITACGSFLTAVTIDGLVHDGSAPLTTGVQAARTRPLGGAWVWDETRPGAAALRAATLAAWVYHHRPERARPMPKPVLRTLAG